MEQQHSGLNEPAPETGKVRLSLGTKLTIAVLGLLVVVIGFLNLSTILLFKDDKRAYIYQSQATNAVLAGREFVTRVRHSLDALRQPLASVDSSALQAITAGDTAVLSRLQGVLNSYANNQTEAVLISVFAVDPTTGAVSKGPCGSREKDLTTLGLSASQFELTQDSLKPLLPELQKNSFALVNLSNLGSVPALGVLMADFNLKSTSGAFPVAMAVLPLSSFGRELKGLALTIATRSGQVLFASDAAAQFTEKAAMEDPLFKRAVESKVAGGAAEFDAGGLRYLGSYVQPGLDLIVTTRTEWRKAMKATYSLIETVIYLGLMAVGAAAVLAILFSKTLVAPLNRLYKATREVASGNFSVNLAVNSSDEIGSLTRSFNAMSGKISELIQEQVRKAHLENELAIASTVQQTLIPPVEFRDQDVLIRSHYQSASECGGDWWGFFRVGSKLCVMIADATGHGLPSALITASARSGASVLQKLAEDDPEFSFSPAAMLSYANRVIYEAANGKIMMTFFVGVIDFDMNTLTYSSAGHNPPWLFKKGEGSFQMKSMVASGMRLGEQRENNGFEEKTVPISPEDILFLYTDGLIEGKDNGGEMYGKKRAKKMIESLLVKGPESIISGLMGDFLGHNGDKALDDDVTLAILQFQPQHKAAAPGLSIV
jgi:sigma-B regulation protein RsbU (phosphoserine phosphatase)